MRFFLIGFGHLSLLLGIIGIFLPLLPTTPFVLLAATCYSKGSKHFHDWLISHPKLGPMVHEWQCHGVIRPRAKIVGSCLVVLSLSYPILFLEFAVHLKFIAVVVGFSVLAFINSRPSRPLVIRASEIIKKDNLAEPNAQDSDRSSHARMTVNQPASERPIDSS